MVDHKKDSPPNPYPEPRSKEPSELGEKVDWMTYTHQELYDMVHTGVDLTSAASVKDNWTTLGTTLAEVKDQLIGAIFASSSGWEGESAEKARDGLLTVVKWAENTSDHANNVAECITVEIQHVQTAREQMPAPAPAPPVVTPVPTTIAPLAPGSPAVPATVDPLSPVAAPTTPTPVTGAQSPFTGVDQVGAPVVDATVAADAGHRTAANVMAAFQQGSFAVDQTVPAFSPPVNPVAPPEVKPVGGVDRIAAPTTGAAAPVVGPAIVPPVAGRTQAMTGGGGSSGGGGGGYAPAARGGGYSSGGGYQPTPSFGGGGGSGGGGSAAPSGPGGASGVIGGADSRAASAQPSSTQQAPKAGGGSTGGGMMGGAPMAPMGAQSDQADYRRAKYLEEDDDLFGLENKAAPPVIGT